MPRCSGYTSRNGKKLKILVSGSSGFIGSAAAAYLSEQGHDVLRLARGRPVAGEQQARWDPEAGTIDAESLDGVDAVVHLAGENISSRRWTPAQKARILDSRVIGTRLLCETLARLDPPPRVFACASAKDYYGDRGDEILLEESARGTDFLADVIGRWEAATEAAAQGGMRVVNLRFGLVLGASGGALARFLPPFKLGLGGRLGSGKQYVSWISLEDVVRAIDHSLTTPSLHGPINVVAPGAVTNSEFTKTLGLVLSRPTLFPVPALALRLVFGEVAGALLASARLSPAKLVAGGFEFHHPGLETALRAELHGA